MLPIRESFRTLPDAQLEAIPRRLLFLLRKAKVLQMNLVELNEGRNPAERYILRDLSLTPDDEVPGMADKVRAYLGITLEQQIDWQDDDAALEAWRGILEAVGVHVFKDAFRDDSYSGFCLYDSIFPLIYVNNSMARSRQIFTFFHELAHLLFHTSGIDPATNDFIDKFPPDDRRIEVICNQFAAEFLLPDERFEAELRGHPANERTAEALAARFHVSRELVFPKFLDRALVTDEAYRQAKRRWDAQRQPQAPGGNPYWTKIAYLGTRYIRVVLPHYYYGRITEEQLVEYLSTSVKNLLTFADYFARKLS